MEIVQFSLLDEFSHIQRALDGFYDRVNEFMRSPS